MTAYRKYFSGDCPMPVGLRQSALFTLLMAVGMGTCMFSTVAIVTGMDAGTYAFAITHMVPLMVLFGATVRLLVLERPIDYAIGRWLAPRLRGAALTVAIMLLNVAVMATMMCAIGTAVSAVLETGSLEGLAMFRDRYLAILPVILCVGSLVSVFIVGPLAKMLFNRTSGLATFPKGLDITIIVSEPYLSFSNSTEFVLNDER